MSNDKVRWGILSTARIGINNVIPALQAGKYSEVVAIASRNGEKARLAAEQFGIPKSYGTYEALLEDPDVDAIYNPLPNHLHLPWSGKAVLSGKHVLCEKPVAPNAEGARQLIGIAAKHPEIKVMEAFMYRFHPQWDRIKQMISEGRIGELRTITSSFSYFNDNPDNYRNVREYGGGGLLDIGCYCISVARYLFGKEPLEVSGNIEEDPDFHVDRLASALLTFGRGTSVFTCATQLFPDQYVTITGTSGQIKLTLPFNPLPEKPATIIYENAKGTKTIDIEPVDQYMLMTDAFSLSVLEDMPVPTPLDDALNNMKTIDAVFKSAETGRWVKFEE
ncbi:MAG: Gfo/Idh/MocA family oxidoreductase [Chlorobi bacterium]|nr:Gfo/Idh/MocA family oxidoreductase [Chlorobiota bacterium]